MTRESFKRMLTAAWVAATLSGCSIFGGNDRPAYELADETRPLEVPPDLITPAADSRMAIPPLGEGRVSAVETARAAGQSAMLANWRDSTRVPTEEVLPQFANMRVRHQDGVRWLEVDTDPATLWPKLRDFWRQADIELVRSEARLGIMQTGWIEARDGELPGAGLRDSYRLRLERQDADTTNVYITHRGAAQTGSDDTARWEPWPPDVGLEAEYLTRLMVYLGESQQQAEQQLASANADVTGMRLDRVAGIPVLVVEDQFSHVWRLTGVALDRAGLPVEREDVVKGTYYFRYQPTIGEAEGVLTGLSNDDGNAKLDENGRYQVHLLDQPGQTLITVHTAKREALAPAAAEEILERLIVSMQGGVFSSDARFTTLPVSKLDGA